MKYQNIFFDLDHTLWDYDTSARQTLEDLYHRYDLSTKVSSNSSQLAEAFFSINDDLWDKYNKGQISKYVLRTDRFRMVFEAIGVNNGLFQDEDISNFNKDYLYECPQKPNLIEGAIELLEMIKDDFDLHIITNGFEEIQSTKMEKSGLSKYFTKVITSESAGAKKPFNGIFQFAMNKTGADPSTSIMIGDNLLTDIAGARDFGIDQVFFNPSKIEHEQKVSYEVTHLHEVPPILLD